MPGLLATIPKDFYSKKGADIRYELTPNGPCVYSVGRNREKYQEALEGWTLQEVLAVRGALPVQEAVEYAIQASDAVADAHRLGIVHGGLNLSNIVLSRRVDGSIAADT